MLFEVISPKTKKCVCSTRYIECISFEYLDSMTNAGYKFKLDGKFVSKSDIRKLQKTTKSSTVEIPETPTVSDIPKVDKIPKPVSDGLIMCVETKQTFQKQSEAAKFYNLNPAAVSDSLKTGKTRGGYTFVRVEK